tara:strand:- start:281 stop:424 length:144 start_codon:yes stop_codon:yes gene_type:complete
MSKEAEKLFKEMSEQFKRDFTYVGRMKQNPRAAIIRELQQFWKFSND